MILQIFCVPTSKYVCNILPHLLIELCPVQQGAHSSENGTPQPSNDDVINCPKVVGPCRGLGAGVNLRQDQRQAGMDSGHGGGEEVVQGLHDGTL